MGVIGAAHLAGGDAGAATQAGQGYVMLQRYWMKNGTQVGRIHEYLSQGLLPRRAALGFRPTLVLEALVAAHMPQVAVLTPYDSLEAIAEADAKLAADEKCRTALSTWEENAEQPFESVSTSLLASTPYSPKLQPAGDPPKTPRVFELRVYHSPTQRQLAALHERFAGPEIKIFHRSGIHPVLYSSTLFGDDMPNLTYVIPFASLADREKAWAAFGGDPEWTKVRAESIEKHGQISSVMSMSLDRATAYSPIQ